MVVNQIVVAWWVANGYTVVESTDGWELIGRNAFTGLDEPEKTRTITWDTIKESPDGTWYFSSLSNDPRFVDWRDYLPDSVSMPNDKAMSIEWFEGVVE